jgi:hypothetical protein
MTSYFERVGRERTPPRSGVYRGNASADRPDEEFVFEMRQWRPWPNPELVAVLGTVDDVFASITDEQARARIAERAPEVDPSDVLNLPVCRRATEVRRITEYYESVSGFHPDVRRAGVYRRTVGTGDEVFNFSIRRWQPDRRLSLGLLHFSDDDYEPITEQQARARISEVAPELDPGEVLARPLSYATDRAEGGTRTHTPEGTGT